MEIPDVFTLDKTCVNTGITSLFKKNALSFLLDSDFSSPLISPPDVIY